MISAARAYKFHSDGREKNPNTHARINLFIYLFNFFAVRLLVVTQLYERFSFCSPHSRVWTKTIDM